MTTFVDQVVLHVSAGDGGGGCASVRREKFKPLGGPDGGNGGRGGDVVLVVDPNVTTLLDYHHHPHRKATSGRPGEGDDRNGANGEDMVLPVPDGTVVRGPSGEVLVDMVGAGFRFVLAKGGQGGLGNAALANSKRKAPGFALLGEPGDAFDAALELNTVADVPLLIPGASEGKGLGLEFLRHVERCTVLVHVIDCATLEPNRDPLSDLDALEAELAAYGSLEDRPRLVALNKVDVAEAHDLAELVREDLEARGLPVFIISAVSREGLRELTFAMAAAVEAARAALPEPEATRIVLRPKAVDESGFVVKREGDSFRVIGEKPTRWVKQTDFSNEEAVGYLADRLNRLGVERALADAGAVPGSEVLIGDDDNAVVF